MTKILIDNNDSPYLLLLHPDYLLSEPQKYIADFDVIKFVNGKFVSVFNRIKATDLMNYIKIYNEKRYLEYSDMLIVTPITPIDGWDTIFMVKLQNDRFLIILRDQLYVVRQVTDMSYLLTVEFLFSSSNLQFVISHMLDEKYDLYNVLNIKDFGIITSLSKLRKFKTKIYYNQIRDITLGIYNFNWIQWKTTHKLFDVIAYTNDCLFFDANHYQMLLRNSKSGLTLFTAYLATEYQQKFYLDITLQDFSQLNEIRLLQLLMSFQEGNNREPISFWSELGLKYMETPHTTVFIREKGKHSIFCFYQKETKKATYKLYENAYIDQVGIDRIFENLYN